jgi:hypothetical protein
MSPGLQIREFVFPGSETEYQRIEECLKASEIAFVQTGLALAGYRKSFSAIAPRVIVFPAIYFAAYHPDLLYLRSADHYVETPLLHYNSKLAFAGYLEGLSVDATVELFEESVFRRVGYLDAWDTSVRFLRREIGRSDLKLDDVPARWSKAGAFMYSVNHPRLRVLADVAHAMLRSAGLNPRTSNPETYLVDRAKSGPVWPIYPAIGAALGIEGDYCFKRRATEAEPTILELREFVAESFTVYDSCPKESFQPDLFDVPAFRKRLFNVVSHGHARPPLSGRAGQMREEPADGVTERPRVFQEYQVWKRSVASVALSDLDPVVRAKVQIQPDQRVASIGSCFAQHISRRLKDAGLNYYVTEPSPVGLSPEEAQRRSFGTFSARYGNVYTARQLRQLFDRAFGDFAPTVRPWRRPDGKLVDPFRPAIEPDGYGTEGDVEEATRTHLLAVRRLFETLDVIVVTLGLTEAWRARSDGAVFPVAPGVIAGEMKSSDYEFVNFEAGDIATDLDAFLAKLRSVNPQARAIFTVSPVPLVATYEDRHVLVSTTYSKSALRVAAESVCRAHASAYYFPSYEIVTSHASKGAYFAENLRSVTERGVDHVMRLFLRHVCSVGEDSLPSPEPLQSGMDVICDEESILGA